MRILHVITRMILGGAQENTLLTVLGQMAAGHEVVLVTGPSEGEEGEIETRAREAGVNVVLLPDLVRELSPARDLSALRALYRVIRDGGYHIVHTHTSKAGILGRIAARLARAPAVIHTPHGHVFHSYYSPVKTRLFWLAERVCAPMADRIVTLTENEKREHVELRIARADRFTTIHSGVDFSQFLASGGPAPPFAPEPRGHGGTAERENGPVGPQGDAAVALHPFTPSPLHPFTPAPLGIPDGVPVIGCVARLVPIKGHTHLLDAMPAVLARFPEARLLLVGDGPLTADLQAQAERLGIAGRVVFAGLRRDVPDLLRLMDVFALASLNEGMGRVLVEAMACRLPVVATRVSGIPDVVDHGVTGLLVEPRAPEAMAEALIALLADPAYARRLGQAGYEKVVPAFSVEAMVEQIEALYLRVLEAKGIRLPERVPR